MTSVAFVTQLKAEDAENLKSRQKFNFTTMQNVFLTHSGVLAVLLRYQNGFAFFANHGAFRRECSLAEFEYLKNSGHLIPAKVESVFDCDLPRWQPVWTVNDFASDTENRHFATNRVQHYYYAAKFPDGTWHFRTYTQHFRNDRTWSYDYLGRPQNDVCVCYLQNVDDNAYIHIAGHGDVYDVLERYSSEVKFDEAICACASDEKQPEVKVIKARLRRLAEIGFERPWARKRR
jgi:hypothetical protein